MDVSRHSYEVIDAMRQFTLSIMQDKQTDVEKDRERLLSSLTKQYGILRENTQYFDASVTEAAEAYMISLLDVQKRTTGRA